MRAAIFQKIITVNKNMVSSGRKDAAFNPEEEAILVRLREALEENKPIPPRALELVVRMVTRWDYNDRLAGQDLLRCMAKYPAVAQFSNSDYNSILDLAINVCEPPLSLPSENSVMMGLRTIANTFGSADGRSIANEKADDAIAFFQRVTGVDGSEAIGKHNRNVLTAATTAILNYAVLANREKLLTPDQRRRLLVILGDILTEQRDSEVLYRALVALGTLLSTSKEEAAGLAISKWIQVAGPRSSEDRVHNVARECSKLVSR